MKIKIIVLVALLSSLMLAGCEIIPSTPSTPSGPSAESPGGIITGGETRESSGTVGGNTGSAGRSSSSDATTSSRGDADEDATTSDERSGALSKKLDDSLGEFDKTLSEEQQKTAAERDARVANRSATTSTQDSDAGIGRREGDLRSERTGQSGNGGGEKPSGDSQDRGVVVGSGSGAPDRSRPSGEDDDIVARRLRRAAEQETDPELKEKLWKEYTEYKRNVQGKG